MNKIELIIGDYSYYVSHDRIKVFPDSYFAVALSPQWNNQYTEMNQKFIQLQIDDTNRDVELFEYIVDFLRYGCLPCNDVNGNCLIDKCALSSLRVEADYFCLHEMTAKIDTLLKASNCSHRLLRDGLRLVDKLNERTWACGTDVISRYNFCESRGLDADEFITNGKYFKELSSSLYNAVHNTECVVYGEGDWSRIIEKTKFDRYRHCLHHWDISDEFSNDIHYILNTQISFEEKCNVELLGMLVNTPEKTSKLRTIKRYNHSDVVYGTLLVVAPRENSGGLITITSTQNETMEIQPKQKEKYTFIFIWSHCDYKINKITSGTQVIYVLHVLKGSCSFENPNKNFNIKRRFDSRLKSKYENNVFREVIALLGMYNYIGIIFEKDYVSEGLRADSLVGFDATLYAKMISMEVPVH